MTDIIATYMYPVLKALVSFPTYEDEITMEEIDAILATVVDGVPDNKADITVASVDDVRAILQTVVNGIESPENATEYLNYKVVQGHTPAKAKGVINIYYAPGNDAIHHFGFNTSHIFKPKVRITVTGLNYASGLHAALFIKDAFKQGKLNEEGTAGAFIDGDINYLGYNEEGCPEFELDYKTIIVD